MIAGTDHVFGSVNLEKVHWIKNESFEYFCQKLCT